MNIRFSKTDADSQQLPNTLLYYACLLLMQGFIGYIVSDSILWPVVFAIIFLVVINLFWHFIATIVILWFFSKKNLRHFIFESENNATEEEKSLERTIHKTSCVLVIIPVMLCLVLLTYSFVSGKLLTATQLVPLIAYLAWGILGFVLARRNKIRPLNIIDNEIVK